MNGITVGKMMLARHGGMKLRSLVLQWISQLFYWTSYEMTLHDHRVF
jgi:hypothetical protein